MSVSTLHRFNRIALEKLSKIWYKYYITNGALKMFNIFNHIVFTSVVIAMNRTLVNVKENNLYHLDISLLEILLKDRSSRKTSYGKPINMLHVVMDIKARSYCH